MPEQKFLFLEDGTRYSEKDAALVRPKYEKLQRKLPEIDKLINGNSDSRGYPAYGKGGN